MSSHRPQDVQRTSCGQSVDEARNVQTQTETETKERTRTPVLTEDWGSPTERAAAAAIHPLDALTVTVAWLRPDWDQRHIRTVIARMTVPWRARALAALRAATDERIRTPWAIENLDTRGYEPTPAPPRLAELRTAERCPNGAIHDQHPCALCRAATSDRSA